MTQKFKHIIQDATGPQKMMGYVLAVKADNLRTVCWLDIGPQHQNLHGALHGGIIATLLDSVSGFTGSMDFDATGGTPFQSISLNTHFIAPARKGRVTARAEIKGRGRKLYFVDAKLMDEDGQLIATSSGVFKAIRPQNG